MFEITFMFAVMVHSDDDQLATPHGRGESSSQKRKCSSTGVRKITRFSSEGHRMVVQYNELLLERS